VFAYDSLNRETSMSVTPTGMPDRTTTTSYYPSGERRERTKPNGTRDRWYWTARGEEARHDRVRAGQAEAEHVQEYAYDANGNRTQDERGTHEFNARDQLVRWTRGPDHLNEALRGTRVDYTLNGDGAILTETEFSQVGVQVAQTTNEYRGERLVSSTDMTGRSLYDYDDFGNVRKIVREPNVPDPLATTDNGTIVPAGCPEIPQDEQSKYVTHYCFDEFSRLRFSKGQEAEGTVLEHDGWDRRDRELSGPSDAQRVSDVSYIGTTEQLSRENSEDGPTTYDYDSAGDRQGRQGKESDNQVRYRAFAKDANGSVQGLEAADGSLRPEDQYSYDPYGDLESRTGTQLQPSDAERELSPEAADGKFRFQGFYYDAGIKTYDMHARHYRPDIGRFLSRDQFASAAGDQTLQADTVTQNRYAFAGGNPVTNVEFDGHCGPCIRLLEKVGSAGARGIKGLVRRVRGTPPTIGPRGAGAIRGVGAVLRSRLGEASLSLIDRGAKSRLGAAILRRLGLTVRTRLGPTQHVALQIRQKKTGKTIEFHAPERGKDFWHLKTYRYHPGAKKKQKTVRYIRLRDLQYFRPSHKPGGAEMTGRYAVRRRRR